MMSLLEILKLKLFNKKLLLQFKICTAMFAVVSSWIKSEAKVNSVK